MSPEPEVVHLRQADRQDEKLPGRAFGLPALGDDDDSDG
jgi:hypothetical protein